MAYEIGLLPVPPISVVLVLISKCYQSYSFCSSHLVTVSQGPMLSDALVSSPIVVGEDGSGAVPGGMQGFEFGIDPNEDPELALVSMLGCVLLTSLRASLKCICLGKALSNCLSEIHSRFQ